MTALTKIGDYDTDSIQDLKVQFNRTAILQMVKAKGVKIGNVTLSLTGNLVDGTPFEGNQIIKIRMPSGVNIDGIVDICDLARAGMALGASHGSPRWEWAVDENEDGIIEVFDLILIVLNFGYTY